MSDMSKLKRLTLIVFFVFFSFLALGAVSHAENRALEQLLDLFEKKGVISPQEVKRIKQTLAEDQERLEMREREIEEKEKALSEREKDLKAKEEALQAEEHALSESAKVSPETSAEEKPAGKVETVGTSAQQKTGWTPIPLQATYREGFCVSTSDPDQFALCLGGLLQVDYRYYDYDGQDPENNGFDLRRVRLLMAGHLSRHFDYRFLYEYQGASSRNLLDAYVDARLVPEAALRIGQFKEPFGLDQSTKDKDIWFAEKSFAFYLSPQRDVGVMAHGSLLNDRIDYGLGVFNGNGPDDSETGDEDSPQVTTRLVFYPLKNQGFPLFRDLQLGGSFSYANIDRNNVDIQVKTSGLTTFFDVSSAAKFNVIREADWQRRYGLELGWAYGPVAVAGEYVNDYYKDITTSSQQFDTELEAYYVSLLWMLTGERPTFERGVIQTIRPLRSVWQGGWGAFGLAFRYDVFKADDDAYENLITQGFSVSEAKAYTIALNWYLNPKVRLILDATRTDFDSPLLIDRDPLTGTAIYSDREDVFTGRFQFVY
jgi:phosphate-selective porin OprO/OprP